MDEADFMAEVEAVEQRRSDLPTLHAALLVALREGVAADTRSLAKVFGIAHALTLRAVAELTDGERLVNEVSRDPRTQRIRLALTEAGRALVGTERARLAA